MRKTAQILGLAKTNPDFRRSLVAELRRQANQPSELILKWMQARVKKGKGAFVPAVVQEALAYLPGWSLEETTVYVTLNAYGGDDILESLGILGNDFRFRQGDAKTPCAFIAKDRGPAGKLALEKLIPELEQKGTLVAGNPKVPSGTPKIKEIYLTKPGPIQLEYANHICLIQKMWVGFPGWTVTAPNGKSGSFAKPANRRTFVESGPAYDTAAFWTFGYKNGLVEDCQKVLDQQDPTLIEDLGKSKADRERVQALRAYNPEVTKVLKAITDAKYQGVVKFWRDYYEEGVAMYEKAQAEANAQGKRLAPSNWLKGSSGEAARQDFVRRVFSQEHWDPEKKLVTHLPSKQIGVAGVPKAIEAEAKRVADEGRAEFLEKNTIKLSAIVNKKGGLKEAKVLDLNDAFWDYGGEILFTFEDGSRFTVRNKTIWKVSPNGKQFAQFPTTFHNVILPNGKAMSSPSEERMVSVFPVLPG